jgi:hypothetical protein
MITIKKIIATVFVLIFFANFSMKSNKIEISIPISISEINEQKEWEEFDKIMKTIQEEELKKIESNRIRLFSTLDPSLINEINKIKPEFLTINKYEQYDKYDEDIIDAVKELKEKGESPNANFIKTIMLIETGMKPVKNTKGYEGFPQTKIHIIKSVNNKNGTNFTLKDMYDAKKSAQFIHYYTKGLKEYELVKNDKDLIIAYNWGIGNLKKYKEGTKELPKQSKDYINMIKVMKKYYI